MESLESVQLRRSAHYVYLDMGEFSCSATSFSDTIYRPHPWIGSNT